MEKTRLPQLEKQIAIPSFSSSGNQNFTAARVFDCFYPIWQGIAKFYSGTQHQALCLSQGKLRVYPQFSSYAIKRSEGRKPRRFV